MKTIFRRLVRIKATDGSVTYAEAGESVRVGDTVQVYTGDHPWALEGSGKSAEIAEVQTCVLASFSSLCRLTSSRSFAHSLTLTSSMALA